jgi:hypothetical protein
MIYRLHSLDHSALHTESPSSARLQFTKLNAIIAWSLADPHLYEGRNLTIGFFDLAD